jgi:transglutaminase-like putative cysteine protease
VGVLLAAIVVAVPSRLDARPQAIVVLAALLGLTIVRRRDGSAAAGSAVAVAVLLTAAIAGPYLSTWLPGRPYDVRDHLSTPVVPRADLSPLDRVADYRSRPDERLFTVTSTAAGPWRLAVLDRFDGHDWSTSARFTPAGLGVPPADDGAAPDSRPIRQDIELDHLRGDLLPALDRPVRLIHGVTAVDVSSGVLLGPGPGPGRRYTVVSRPPPVPDDGPELGPADGPRVSLDLPAPVPDELSTLAAGIPPSRAGANALVDRLRTGLRHDPSAGTGRSYGHLAHFLTGTRSGSPEQFATAFALAARRAGMPSRLVVGFTGGTTAGTTHTVSGRHATVWVEINFDGAGWIAFDPTPPPDPASTPTPGTSQPTRPAPPSATPAPHSPTPTQVSGDAADGFGGRSDGPTERPDDGYRTWWWWLVGAAFAAGAGAYTVIVLTAPARRRSRRRRARDPRARTILAWHDLLESTANVAPRTRLARMTTRQVADLIMARIPTRADVDPLVTFADIALYSDDGVDDEVADLAWALADEARPAIVGAGRRPVRWIRRLSPKRFTS